MRPRHDRSLHHRSIAATTLLSNTIACSVQLHNFWPVCPALERSLSSLHGAEHTPVFTRVCRARMAGRTRSSLLHTHARTSLELRLGARCTTDNPNGRTARCCISHGGRPPYTRRDLRCGYLEDGRCSTADEYHLPANSKLATGLNGEEYESLVGADLRAASDGGVASEFVSSQ